MRGAVPQWGTECRQGLPSESARGCVTPSDTFSRPVQLATDFYEYGWGESFHFAHTKAGESHEASILRHEMRIIDELGIQEGHKVLDAGCGVGGPARAIAKASKAKVTGVTLNAYQVWSHGVWAAPAPVQWLAILVPPSPLSEMQDSARLCERGSVCACVRTCTRRHAKSHASCEAVARYLDAIP